VPPPTIDDDDIELDEYAASDTTTSAGRTYLQMEVADFDNELRHSYLRLGAVDPGIITKHEAYAAPPHTDPGWDTATGEDLACLVTEFIDDKRYRGGSDDTYNADGTVKTSTKDSSADANKFRKDSQSTRQTNTAELHTKGGWRDHTDGNRVTTTRGDKVEVIRGNYKMRVLGRSQWTTTGGVGAGSGLHSESSGGISYDYDEVPGQIIDVRWSLEDDTWTVMEQCDSGHQVDRYHGVKKEWFQGGDIVDRFGSQTAYDSDIGDSWIFTGDDDFGDDDDLERPGDAPHGSASWPTSDTLANVREETYANEIWEKTICNTLTSKNGSWTRMAKDITETTYGTTIEIRDEYDTFIGTSVAGGTAIEFWNGAFSEFYKGIGLSMKIGAFADLRCGFSSEITASVGIGDVALAKAIGDFELSIGSFMDASFNAISLEFELGGAEVEGGSVKYDRKALSFMRFTGALFFG
jgi:hypothetical protein